MIFLDVIFQKLEDAVLGILFYYAEDETTPGVFPCGAVMLTTHHIVDS